MISPGKSGSRIASYLLAAIALLFLAATILVGGREASFVLGASRAAATFDGAVARSGGNHGGTFLYPQFKFVTSDGQSVEVTSRIGSTGQPYYNGQKDFVLYDPRNPSQAVLDHFWILWAPTVVLGLITLLFTGITWGIWRYQSR